MKLFCLVVNDADAVPLPIDVDAGAATVGDMKDAIKAKEGFVVKASALRLFLARKDDEWLQATDANMELARTDKLDESWFQCALNPTSKLSKAFAADLGEDVIHVLARLPEEAEEEMKLRVACRAYNIAKASEEALRITRETTTKRIKALEEQKKLEEEQKKLAEEQKKREEEQRALEEEKRRVENLPAKRKRDWNELNDVLNRKRGKDGSTAFSSVEYESLPERFRPDRESEVSEGPFFDLMNSDRALASVDDEALDVLVEALEAYKWAYKNSEVNEATKVQFLGVVFVRLLGMLKAEDLRRKPKERTQLHIESKMVGRYVKANGQVDFKITRGRKTICIVEAKKDDFDKGSAQSILGMEVAVDNNDEECVYGVVSTYSGWRFLKRTDDGVEMYRDTIGPNLRTDVKRVLGRLYAMLTD